MTTGHVFIGMSVDGFIARADGDIGWLDDHSDPNEDHGYTDFMSSMDGFVMGRATFQKVLTFEGWEPPKPLVVASRSMHEGDIPDRLADKVSVTDAAPRLIMEALASQGWSRAYIDGGRLIRAFLSEGLIADITLTRLPVLIGEGIPLFGPVGGDIPLRHRSTRSYPSGLVQSTYDVVRSRAAV